MIFPLKGIVDAKHPRQGLQDIKNIGCSHIYLDFSMFINICEWNKNEYIPLIEKLSEMQISVDAAILPDIYTEEQKENTDNLRQQLEISEFCIYMCEGIGCRNIIIQPVFNHEDSTEECVRKIKEYCMELLSYCNNDSTRLLLYNKYKKANGHYIRSVLSSGEKAVTLIDEMNAQAGRKRFGFALDTGSCNLGGQDMNEMVKSLDGHLDVVIFRENNGMESFSALPFTNFSNGLCSTDWLSLIRGLRNINCNPLPVLDFSTTAANFSPILRPGLLSLAKSVGDYFEWQIGIEEALKKYNSIVLFGAGNMCHNFMKCYGVNHLPLFICDNNSSLWGTKFEGIEIKPPELLKEISADCGIFICNIYYREIEIQLRELGVKNIEYFNDEYMPSFYFDRLERRE